MLSDEPAIKSLSGKVPSIHKEPLIFFLEPHSQALTAVRDHQAFEEASNEKKNGKVITQIQSRHTTKNTEETFKNTNITTEKQVLYHLYM